MARFSCWGKVAKTAPKREDERRKGRAKERMGSFMAPVRAEAEGWVGRGTQGARLGKG
jgi:hypothetical protein